MSLYGTIFLLLISLISVNSDNDSTKTLFQKSIYQYTYKLMKEICQENQSNFIVSSLSSWMLLSAMSLGASKKTLVELQQEAGIHPDKSDNVLNLQYAMKVMKELSTIKASIFEHSSILFFDKSLPIKESFRRNVSKLSNCDVQTVSFVDFMNVMIASNINDLVRNATNDAIDEIVTAEDVSGVLALMLDALYFNGAWKMPFPFEDTITDTFYNITGEPIGDVSLMYLCDVYNFTWISEIQSNVLELPYGDDAAFSMLILLPKHNLSIKNLINLLPTIEISSIFQLFEIYGPKLVTVQIPRFKISSSFHFKKHLIRMGVKDVFDYQQASFPDISQQRVFVSNFIQKVTVAVNEDGTAEANPTVSLFDSRLLEEQFTVNRPFMFMVVHRSSHIPVLTGAYTEPGIFSRGENYINDDSLASNYNDD